jgi:hypothetical protein
MAKKISASVGQKGGVNRYEDVVTVQKLLNQVPATDGGPKPFLEVDGKCGPKTKKAIQLFQVKQIGWSGADGRVDPSGPTLDRLNTYDQSGGTTPSPPSPPSLPKGNRFVIHRMASRTIFVPNDRELFFQIVDMTHGRIGIYWLRLPGKSMTRQRPPERFNCPSRSFRTTRPFAVNELICPASYSSRQISGRTSSSLAMFFSSGPAQINNMPHHLIGPGGMIGPGSGNTSTAIAGKLEFVRLG